MAESVSTALGEALIALVGSAWPTLGPRSRSALETVAEVVRPRPPLSIITTDGETLTGVIVAERGRVLAFLGTRQAPPPSFSQNTSEYNDGSF